MKKKRVIGSLIIAAIVAAIWWYYAPLKKTEPEKPLVKIGVLLPLSGETAFAGKPVQTMILQALKDIRKARSLNYDYELIFDDTQNSTEQSLANANRLYRVNRVNSIISMWAPAAIALNDFAEKNKIIHLGCSWGYEAARGEYNFNHATFPEEQTEALVNLLKKHDVKTIGLVWDAEKKQQELIDILKDKLLGNGIRVVFDNMITQGMTDFRLEIIKMQAKKPDVLFMLMMPPEMNQFVQQMNESDWKVPMTSIEYFSFAPELFEGSWYIGDALGDENFGKYAQEKSGSEASSCMANLYDGLKMIVEGYEKTAPREKGKIPDNEDVVQRMLNNFSFKSVTGKINIDKDGNIHTQPVVKVIKDGKPVTIND